MSILHSYRWRRRLAFTAIVLGVAGPLIWLGVRYSDPGNPENANGPTVADYEVSRNVPFTVAQRRQVHQVLKAFIATAVVRQNVAKAWDLAGPSLKQGLTRKQWDNGELPVIPYPALDRGWGKWSFVQYSYELGKKHTVGVEVFLFPKPNSGWSAMTADVEVVRSPNGRWLVDYWMPKRFHGPPAVAHTTKAKASAKKLRERHAEKAKAKAQAKAKEAPASAEGATQDTARVRGAWWALPLGLLGLAIILPLTIGGFVWYRNRRAERAYFRAGADDNRGSRT
jgi:hypothetical protein